MADANPCFDTMPLGGTGAGWEQAMLLCTYYIYDVYYTIYYVRCTITIYYLLYYTLHYKIYTNRISTCPHPRCAALWLYRPKLNNKTPQNETPAKQNPPQKITH